MDSSILLIGGSNIDYIATSNEELIKHNSNIGELEVSFGGVMRNVVENLCRVGAKCTFITAIGKDSNGLSMFNYMEKLGASMHSPNTELNTSSYIAINNKNRDMEYAINDMRIMGSLNPTFLSANINLFEDHEYIVIESNLTDETIEWIFSNFKDRKILCEGISQTKIMKFEKYLKDIYLLKCNLYEANAILHKEGLDAKKCIQALTLKGVKNCVITQGKDEIAFYEKGLIDFVPVKENNNIHGNTTGCGDALFSGVVDYLVRDNSLKDAIIFGTKLSAITLESSKANNPDVAKFSYPHKN